MGVETDTAGHPGDARFFARTGPHRLGALAELVGGTLVGGDVQALFAGIAPLQLAGPGEVSFLDNVRYVDALKASRAGAVILQPRLLDALPAGCAAIVTPEPYAGWARVAGLFHPPPPVVPGVHASAVVDASAQIDPSAEIGPCAVVGARAEIGPGCRIGAGAVIGHGVVLGADCRIGPHVSISHAILGARVCVLAGARIGEEGFGFAATAQGFLDMPQLGRVLIGDDVAIGANTTIDRGSAQDTIIGAGSRLDNLVQIGHNVRLGRCCVIVALAGISGSTELEDFVTLGGQVGVAGHLRIGKGARIGAQAGVMADVPAKAELVGTPAQPVRAFFRQVATLRRLSQAGGDQAGSRQRTARATGGTATAHRDTD